LIRPRRSNFLKNPNGFLATFSRKKKSSSF